MSTEPDDHDAHLPESAIAGAALHVADILALAIEHPPGYPALIVADTASRLARGLAEAYRRCLPDAAYVDFDASGPIVTRAALDFMPAGALVVLVQSTSFRLDAFRIRVELFRRGLKVIEHPHLARMRGDEALVYLDALAYDPAYYRGVGAALKARIDVAQTASIESVAGSLVFPAGLEPAKLNVGDYRNLPNVGGQYPIGEVFTESRVLMAVHGRATIAFFGDTQFNVQRPPRPIHLTFEGGRVVGVEHTTDEFERVLANIRADEVDVMVRELGFGLNRAFNLDRTVRDIGTFERMCGVHLSLGQKHASYAKPDVDKKTARHHVDVFVAAETVSLDGQVVYRDGAWDP